MTCYWDWFMSHGREIGGGVRNLFDVSKVSYKQGYSFYLVAYNRIRLNSGVENRRAYRRFGKTVK
jgi:hypothetical protein